jgi:uncharacterized DUF497 family protein
MDFLRILWDADDDPGGNVWHLAEHDLTVEDVEHVLTHSSAEGVSRSTGLPVLWGYTPDGRYVIVVYETIDKETIRIVTAYDVPEPKGRR